MREIILDTETTGLRPSEGHKVIEIAAVEIIDFLPTGKSYQQYINPERDVPQSSIDIHGLTREFLADKPIFTRIADGFKEFIRDDKIIAHNVDFDIGFINHELQSCGKSLISNKTLDTVSIAREKFPGQSVSLDALCKRFSIDNTQRKKHSATLDTDLLARVYIELVDAREPSLGLEVEKERKVKNSTFDIKKIKTRTLPNRLTSEEKKLHEEFIKTLGKHSVWKSISNK